ncbi:MAG: hypothetical protein ABIK62_05075, partial [candidate division WOR-3 bacterium]
GGSLAYDPEHNLVFALKGNNTLEYYAYNCSTGLWSTRESIPFGPNRKRVKKGATLTYGDGMIYATKGNGTNEFWAYDVNLRTWSPRHELPAKVKGGATSTFVPAYSRLYLAQGSNSQGFWAYYPDGDSWTLKAVFPLGMTNKRPKEGTCIAFDGAGTIYALKGKTTEFFSYDVTSDVWTQRKDIPKLNPQTLKRKTVGDGGAMAFASGRVYVFKGNNLDDFWNFDPGPDSWSVDDSVFLGTLRKRVKAGAALTEARGKIYALKGNSTFEFYRYNADVPSGFTGFAHDKANTFADEARRRLPFALGLAPNPFTAQARITYSLPEPGLVRLELFDAAGRRTRCLFAGDRPAGIHSLCLDDPTLAAGVHFLRASFATGQTRRQLTVKFLVQH